MSKVLLTILGTSDYKECEYVYEEKSLRTKFVQEAIISFFCKDWKKDNGDRIVILLTKEAKEKNYAELKEKLDRYNLDIKESQIPIGKTEDELWQIFDRLSEHVNNQDEVILDITNSLRNIPMQAMVSLNYNRIVKNIDLKGIYYGAFEAGEEVETIGLVERIKKVPIFNLETYIELMEWCNHINVFLRTGSSKELNEYYNLKEKNYSNNEKREFSEIKKVVKSINDFANCIYTMRGKADSNSKKSIGKSAELVSKEIKKLNSIGEINGNALIPLKKVFELVEIKVQPFITDDPVKLGMATVKWCIEYNLVQQGFTALEETITTYSCRIKELNELEYTNRTSIYEQIEKSVEIQELISIWRNVKGIRNDINHFGYKDNQAKYTKISENLEKNYNEFEKYLENLK